MSIPAPERPAAVTIGLRELRQNASDVVRQAEAGTEFVVTVAGRAAARLAGTGPRTWCTASALDTVFATPAWGADDTHDYLDQDVRDPWDRGR